MNSNIKNASPKYPVAIFLWRRRVNLDVILGEIKKYDPPHLYIFVDGARNAEDKQEIDLVVQICNNKLLGTNIGITYDMAPVHFGLHKRYRTGINTLFNKAESAIILEDDTIPSPDFFEFCSYNLTECYHRKDIVAINGFLKTDDDFLKELNVKEAFTHHIFNPWGWASWSHKILPLYNPDIKKVSWWQSLWVFTLWWNFDLFYLRRRLLRDVESGKLITWDVQLQWSIFLKHKKVLTSPINLISNVGNDEFASTFVAGSKDFNQPTVKNKLDFLNSPIRHIKEYDMVLSRSKSNYRFFIKKLQKLKQRVL